MSESNNTLNNGYANQSTRKSLLYGGSNDGTDDWIGKALKTAKTVTAGGNKKAGVASITDRTFRKLDAIHIMFLLYSGAHNIINSWHRAESILFFLFVVVGVLSVEFMLHELYHSWKDGKLIGKMLKRAKWGGAVAMFLATAGILSQAQGFTGSAWLDFHYAWIMPTSAPVMFFFSWFIQAADPVTEAQRDAQAQQYFAGVEKRREVIDIQFADLEERKELRNLNIKLKKDKIRKLRAEANSRRTQNTLKKSAAAEMPHLLERAGVSIKDANEQTWLWSKNKYDAPKQIGEGKPKNSAVNPVKIPGSREKESKSKK